MRTYIDKKYNAQLFYPAFFDVVDTCGTGSASFNYNHGDRYMIHQHKV